MDKKRHQTSPHTNAKKEPPRDAEASKKHDPLEETLHPESTSPGHDKEIDTAAPELPKNATHSEKKEPSQPDPTSQGKDDTIDPRIALEAAQTQAKNMEERYLRAMADLENLRKRTTREKQELSQFAAARIIEAILPILDSFEIGIQAAEKEPQAHSITQGFKMVYEQLNNLLSDNDLQTLNPLGAPFDPNRHECVAHQPSTDASEGTVTAVTRIGYSLHERLLRPASVVVSSGPASKKEATPSD